MSKTEITNPAFNSEIVGGFNLVNDFNSFNSVFGKYTLQEGEIRAIEKLVVEYSNPMLTSDEKALEDLKEMKLITAEIRSIGKQSLILVGERVFKAREILKHYQEGGFTRWLLETFGCRRTGYNYLNYFEFYKELPDGRLKEEFSGFPQKFAYKLASRKGDMSVKLAIMRDYPLAEMDKALDEKLPLKVGSDSKLKSQDDALVGYVVKGLEKLLSRTGELSQRNLSQLSHCEKLISKILSGSL